MSWQNWLKRMFFAPEFLLRSPANKPTFRRRPRRLDVELLESRIVPALTINATFAANIQSDPNAAAIENTMNQAVQIYEANISNSITVNMTFQEMTNGFGANETFFVPETYSSYLTALQAHATSADDTTAFASLGAGPDNPVNGGTMIDIQAPLARALGYSGASNANIPMDSTISINTSICNLTRPDANPNKYDLLAVTLHEMDEALGGGSALDGSLQNAAAPAKIEPLDLYRYDQNGNRSFNTALATQAFFSIDGGVTDLAQFNQDASGDFGDWLSAGNNPPAKPQVQDAFLFPQEEPNLGVELRRLDVLGFTLATSTAPTVTMTAPINNSDSNINLPSLSANVTDNSGTGIASVQFETSSDNGSTWQNAGAAETAASFSFTFTTALPDGSYEARAVALDNAGNTTNSTPVSFIIDTVGPTTSNLSVLPSPASAPPTINATLSDASSGNNNIVAVEFFIDTVGNNGSGTALSGTFTSATVNVSGLLTIAQFIALSPGMHTIFVHGEDAAGNWGATVSQTFVVQISTTPTVLALAPSVPTITGAQVGSTGFALSVTFNEVMDTSVAPNISFSPLVPSTLTFAAGTWDPTGAIYTAFYNVAGGSTNVSSIAVAVTGAQNAAGNAQVADNQNGVFAINTQSPVALSATPSVGIITSALAGSTFKLTLLFNAKMKSSIAPVIVFNPAIASTLTLVAASSAWNAADRAYTAAYKIAASGVNLANVGVTVTGAQDANGNPQLAFTQGNVFAIDTANPTVTSITPSAATITDAQLGHGTFTLAIHFGAAMNTKVLPTIGFSPSVSPTLTRISGTWDVTHTIYTATYNVANSFVSVPSVTVSVSGAKDTDGNSQVAKIQPVFGIDMVNPTVKSITPSVATITDAQVGSATFTLAVKYSAAMNTAQAPTLGFITPIGSTLSFASGSWNAAGTIYTAAYSVAASGVISAGVAVVVSGGRNTDGNLQHPFEAFNNFTINTDTPAVLSVTPSVGTITNAQLGKTGFNIRVAYDEPMNTAVAPLIVFGPTASSTLTFASGTWDSTHTFYTASYSVANAAVTVASIGITVSNGKSSVGNLQGSFTLPSAFAISTTASAAPNISVTATNTTASVNRNYFGESFVATVSGPLTQLKVLDITNLYSIQGQSLGSVGATIQIYAGGINTANPSSTSYDTPAGTLLDSQSFTFTSGNNSIVFAAPPMLQAGQTYLWRVVANGVSTINVDFATTNPYAQGDTLAGPGSGYDLPFQIFI